MILILLLILLMAAFAFLFDAMKVALVVDGALVLLLFISAHGRDNAVRRRDEAVRRLDEAVRRLPPPPAPSPMSDEDRERLLSWEAMCGPHRRRR